MRTWHGVLMIEGVQTGDGRFFEEGSIKWRDLPLGLVDDHPTFSTNNDGIGNVVTIERVDNKILATGTIDDLTDVGSERCRMMDEGTAPMGNRWPVSIEFHDAEVQIIDTTIEENPDGAEGPAVVITASGGPLRSLVAAARTAIRERIAGRRALLLAMAAAAGDGAPEGVVLFEAKQDDIVERYTNARIHNVATVTAGAIEGAYIELDAVTSGDDSGDEADDDQEESLAEAIINADVVDLTGENAIIAAAAPIKPPRAWFYEPEPEPGDERLVPQYDIDTGEYIGDAVPLHIGDDGQVYGHVAPANRCHIGFDGVCVVPPQSASAYSHFHFGYTVTDDGDVATGPLCCNSDHAGILGLDERAAKDWYANTGLGWANVRVTPGQFGPWACGSLRPGITDELVVALRGGGISGDWRGSGNGLELIGILAVSVPGFTVQRALAATAGSVKIMRAQSAMTMTNGKLRVITPPVLRSSADQPHDHACSKCGGGPSEELRLLRLIATRTAVLNPQRREQLRARLRP